MSELHLLFDLDNRDTLRNILDLLDYPAIRNLTIASKHAYMLCSSKFADLIQTKRTTYMTHLICVKLRVDDPDDLFIEYVEKGNAELVDHMIKHFNIDPGRNYNKAIDVASKFNRVKVIDRLLEDSRVNPTKSCNFTFRLAAEYNCLASVDRLLKDPRIDPADMDNYALRIAAKFGYYDIVDRLLEDSRVDPSAMRNWAIISAVCNSHFRVVDRLLVDPRVDPTDCGGECMSSAVNERNMVLIRRLLDDQRVYNSLSRKRRHKIENILNEAITSAIQILYTRPIPRPINIGFNTNRYDAIDIDIDHDNMMMFQR